MQEILSQNEYEQMAKIFFDICEDAIKNIDTDLEAASFKTEFFYILGVLTATTLTNPSIEKDEFIKLLDVEKDEVTSTSANDEDQEDGLDISMDTLAEIYTNIFPPFVDKTWNFMQDFINKLNKFLSRDEDFELPTYDLEDLFDFFDYEVFAEGFVSAFAILEETMLQEDSDYEDNEELLEALYPMIMLANISDDEDEEENLEEEVYVRIAEDLEYIIASIYAKIQP